MKRLTYISAILFSVTLVSCAGQDGKSSGTDTTDNKTEDTVKRDQHADEADSISKKMLEDLEKGK